MKKLFSIFILTAIVACNKTDKQESKNTNVLWAETIQSILPLERDTLCSEADWNAMNKYDKQKIFSSITRGVLSGKLKAYANYPGKEYTIKEFSNLLTQWDSTMKVEDPNHPGVFVPAPVLYQITAENVTQIRFNEKIELDTVTYSLIRKTSSLTFLTDKMNEAGVISGYAKLFDVKLIDQ